MTEDFEKLGLFYLGKRYDLAARKATDELVLYDSADLVTHAVCIGMTGSGKTGLCLDLVEEAAIDGIPVIAIDPKGDLSNLLLTFPNLEPSDFQPWLDADEARRLGKTVEQLAEEKANLWREGLATWGQSGERIARLKEAADFKIYTPGSSAGLPISIVQSLAAPAEELLDDRDALREKISNTATCLLALLSISADPLKSREHILISNILDRQWRQGIDVTLTDLIQLIQKPPMNQIGALDIESFFPTKERFEFAMSINNLLAAPGFDAWLTGEALDVSNFLYTASGKPTVSIFSIAHLSDTERMFFVSLLLNQVLSWMRSQSGTTSLRAILYMDEIFGFFPPIANPPSKAPLLTLLKQARAFGLGIVLASQNPVDLDYKGLANTGTWFIGRLQTERDKMRVLEGLEGAAATAGAAFNRQKMEQVLAGLGSRVFLMNNVHEEGPEIFETRWSLSFLRGPLTRSQIKSLMAEQKQVSQRGAAEPDVTPVQAEGGRQAEPNRSVQNLATIKETTKSRPAVPPGIVQYFLPPRQPLAPAAKIVYQPMILAFASIHFSDTKAKLDISNGKCYLIEPPDGDLPLNWSDATAARLTADKLDTVALPGASYMVPAGAAMKAASYKTWTKDLVNWLATTQKYYLLATADGKEISKPGEVERDFRLRLQQKLSEQRDQLTAQLRKRYAPKLAGLEDRIRVAQQRLVMEEEEARKHEIDSAISIGATVLGAVMGRKVLNSRTISRAQSAARGVGRTARKKQEAAIAAESLESLREQLQRLEFEFKSELSTIETKTSAREQLLEPVAFTPKKAGINVSLTCLAWAPGIQEADGKVKPLWSE